jgi:hypothetical protein
MQHWRTELTSFIGFTVLFSFFPIIALYLMRMADGHSPTIPELATDGGVLTISISLAAEALSRVVASSRKWRELKLLVASSSLWVIVCGSLFYARRYVGGAPVNSIFFAHVCIVLITFSLMNATASRFLPGGD